MHATCPGPGPAHPPPPIVAPNAAPLVASTATTCAPKTPVTPGGEAGSASGFAREIFPLIDPACNVSVGFGYRMRNPVLSSSPSGASGCRVVGRIPLNVPGAGANGNMIALQTAEWLKPRK